MKRLILNNNLARAAAVRAVQEAPDGYSVTVGETTRNGEQNARLHAAIAEIAAGTQWAGRKWDADTWKRLLTAAWLRTRNESPTILPAIDGHGVEMIYQRTSTLSKAECSELMEYIEAWQAERMAA